MSEKHEADNTDEADRWSKADREPGAGTGPTDYTEAIRLIRFFRLMCSKKDTNPRLRTPYFFTLSALVGGTTIPGGTIDSSSRAVRMKSSLGKSLSRYVLPRCVISP